MIFKNGLYSDGITKTNDPFWLNQCNCGHIFLSVLYGSKCPDCKGTNIIRSLNGRNEKEILDERKSELIQIDQSKSENIRINQSKSEKGGKIS